MHKQLYVTTANGNYNHKQQCNNSTNLGAFSANTIPAITGGSAVPVYANPSAAARSLKYIQGKTSAYVHQKRISLADLIPFCKVPIINNARIFRLELTFKSVGDSDFSMEVCRSSDGAYTPVTAVCLISRVQIESKEMTMSTATSITSAENKEQSHVDHICYLQGSVHTKSLVSGSNDVIINSLKNLQWFSMFQLARKCSNATTATPFNYSSDSQLLLILNANVDPALTGRSCSIWYLILSLPTMDIFLQLFKAFMEVHLSVLIVLLHALTQQIAKTYGLNYIINILVLLVRSMIRFKEVFHMRCSQQCSQCSHFQPSPSLVDYI